MEVDENVSAYRNSGFGRVRRMVKVVASTLWRPATSRPPKSTSGAAFALASWNSSSPTTAPFIANHVFTLTRASA